MFEGKPPELKRAELAKRSTKKEEATTELEAAKEVGGWVGGWVDTAEQTRAGEGMGAQCGIAVRLYCALLCPVRPLLRQPHLPCRFPPAPVRV